MNSQALLFVIFVVVLAIIFDFVNGFHDTANSIATSVTTRSLSPKNAIIMASVLELVGALISTKVAETVGKNIINSQIIDLKLLASTLIAAIIWNIITWYFGIPSSSSHALIGGLIGSALAKSLSFSAIYWNNLLLKVIFPLFFAPIIGFFVGSLFMVILLWLLKSFKPSTVTKWFSKLQIISAGLVALSHGANDAQKSMGIITLALVSGGVINVFQVPLWVKLICATALALGTATGGWKIIKTIGNKICKLRPVNGFAAQTATATVINSATFLIGAPVSTTHIISSAIMGVGTTRRFSAVRWGVAKELVYTWLITIPSCFVVSAITYKLISLF